MWYFFVPLQLHFDPLSCTLTFIKTHFGGFTLCSHTKHNILHVHVSLTSHSLFFVESLLCTLGVHLFIVIYRFYRVYLIYIAIIDGTNHDILLSQYVVLIALKSSIHNVMWPLLNVCYVKCHFLVCLFQSELSWSRLVVRLHAVVLIGVFAHLEGHRSLTSKLGYIP